MSNKTKKAHARLHDGDAFVVMQADDLYRIADTFDVLATVESYSDEEKNAWKDASAHFRAWTKDTVVYFDEDE